MVENYKGYVIQGDGTFGLKVIKSVGAGILPRALKGSFTGFTAARVAIDNYLDSKEARNGKKSSTG